MSNEYSQFTNIKYLLLGLTVFSNTCFAGQGTVNLTSSLSLVAACLINSQSYTNETGVAVGDLDFGNQSSAFDVVTTTLTNNVNNTIKILCPTGINPSIQFGSGNHADSVPTGLQATYSRAMSNGAGVYIAYNLYRDSRNGMLLSPTEIVTFSGGVEETFNLFAEAANTSNLPLGQYTDVLIVTVSF